MRQVDATRDVFTMDGEQYVAVQELSCKGCELGDLLPYGCAELPRMGVKCTTYSGHPSVVWLKATPELLEEHLSLRVAARLER